LNPNELNYSGLGDIYRDLGRFKESEEMFKRALELNPNSEAYNGLGWLYLYQERYDKAEWAFLEYLERVRPKGEVYYSLAATYVSQKKYEEAESALEKSLYLAPTDKAQELLKEVKQLKQENDSL